MPIGLAVCFCERVRCTTHSEMRIVERDVSSGCALHIHFHQNCAWQNVRYSEEHFRNLSDPSLARSPDLEHDVGVR